MSDSVVPSRQVDEHISSPGGTSFQGPNGSRQNPTGESTVVDFTTVRGKAVQGSTADCGPTLDKPPTAESGHEGQDKSPRQGADDDASPATDKPRLSQPLKWTLLFIFSLAMFIDVLCYSSFYVLTSSIAADLAIDFNLQSWIITSYAVTFAAFLLFWGRVSDLYSAKTVFVYGVLALGLVNLVISFLPEKFSFFIFRALAGIAGAALVPASYRLITHVFESHELGKAFTLYGMSGSLSSVFGVLVGGFVEYIPNTGQMVAWRWFFRIIAIIVIPTSLISFYLVPRHKGAESQEASKLTRLDIVGAVLILAAIVLLTLGLTLGAANGWKKPGFLVPFLLSFVLFPVFFYWEHTTGDVKAMVPSKTWRLPNFALFIAFALQFFPWWGINFLGFIETWTIVNHEKPIIAAVRILPEAISGVASALLLTWFPRLVARPRWTIAIGQLFGVVGYILMTRPTVYVGTHYWRYLFPGFIMGSGGNVAAFTGTNVAIMTSVPAEVSGVTGAVMQVGIQLGATIGFAIQAGLLTVNPGGLHNPENLRASFYFQLGWGALWLIGFLVLYCPPKKQESASEEGVEMGKP